MTSIPSISASRSCTPAPAPHLLKKTEAPKIQTLTGPMFNARKLACVKIEQLKRRFDDHEKGSRVYNWIHLIGFLLFPIIGIGLGSVISGDGGRAVLAPVDEIIIFVSGAGLGAWIKFFPKLTGGDYRKISPRRRTSFGPNG